MTYSAPSVVPPAAAPSASIHAFLMGTPCPACGDLWLTVVELHDGEWKATCGNGHALWNPTRETRLLEHRVGPGW